MKTRISIKVQPRAKKTELEGKLGDAYKLRLAAPPVEGKANQACVRFLADRLGVSRSQIRIVSGLTARLKIVEIDGIDPASAERRLLE